MHIKVNIHTRFLYEKLAYKEMRFKFLKYCENLKQTKRVKFQRSVSLLAKYRYYLILTIYSIYFRFSQFLWAGRVPLRGL